MFSCKFDAYSQNTFSKKHLWRGAFELCHGRTSSWFLLLFQKQYSEKRYFLSEHLDFQKQPPEVFRKKGVLRNFTKFTGKHLCQSHFFNKVVGLRPTTLLKKRLLALKKRLWHNCFPVNFAKFLKPSLFTEHLSTTASRCCRVSMEQYEKYIWKPDGCAWKNVAIKNWKNILC